MRCILCIIFGTPQPLALLLPLLYNIIDGGDRGSGGFCTLLPVISGLIWSIYAVHVAFPDPILTRKTIIRVSVMWYTLARLPRREGVLLVARDRVPRHSRVSVHTHVGHITMISPDGRGVKGEDVS